MANQDPTLFEMAPFEPFPLNAVGAALLVVSEPEEVTELPPDELGVLLTMMPKLLVDVTVTEPDPLANATT